MKSFLEYVMQFPSSRATLPATNHTPRALNIPSPLAFLALAPISPNGSAPLGPQKIALTVGYQACNQDACLPPTKLPVTADLEIAAVDTPARPAHTDIFSSAAAEKPPTQH